jgi:hypothetical protein
MDEETEVIENLIINLPEEDASYSGKSIAVVVLIVCVAAVITGWLLR